MSMIRFEQVSKVFPNDVRVLEDVTIVFDQGEFVSIVGPSGAGKSTLLKLILAEEEPTEGRIWFGERVVDSIKRKHLPFYRRKFGTVFQDFKLFTQKTVAENVAYALEVIGLTNEEIQLEVPEILQIVGLAGHADRYPHQLSGGEQQRVSLARALVHRPSVIIADEPTGNLDPVSTQEIVRLLLEINSFGTTVLLATHNQGIVDNLGRRVVAIDRGRVVSDVANGKYVL